MSVNEHRLEAPTTVNCMIITVSDTRTIETDKSGKLMMELVKEAGYEVIGHQIVKDDYSLIKETITNASQNEKVEAVLINGGTGIASSDVTFEAVSDLLEKELPGFGELFRYLSYVEDIGSAAILSRAIAGVFQNKAIFSTPGSTGAVKLAMTKLIMPELGHVMREIYKDRSNNREEKKMDFSHFNEQGRAKMVDISEKVETKRSAVARSEIKVSSIVLDKIENNEMGKGDVLGVAQVAGIMAAKNTAQLIPMCHPLPITGIDISFTTKRQDAFAYINIEALVKTTGKTGVEMEALTAATGTALTIYDMCKAIDKEMVIGPTYIVKKTGGKSDYEKLD